MGKIRIYINGTEAQGQIRQLHILHKYSHNRKYLDATVFPDTIFMTQLHLNLLLVLAWDAVGTLL